MRLTRFLAVLMLGGLTACTSHSKPVGPSGGYDGYTPPPYTGPVSPPPTSPSPTAPSTPPSSTAAKPPAMSAGAKAALAVLNQYNAYYFGMLINPDTYSDVTLRKLAIDPLLEQSTSQVLALMRNHQAYRGSPPTVVFHLTRDLSTATKQVPVVTFTACEGSDPLEMYDLVSGKDIPTPRPTGTAPYPWLRTAQVVEIPGGAWVVATIAVDYKHTCTS